MNSNNVKLDSIKGLIQARGIDLYIIPSTDPHLGEYVPDHWRIVEWLTGFTGSAATLVITDSFAGLWTDSRYFIQAEKQLSGSGFELVNSTKGEKNDLTGWIDENIKRGGKIAFDGRIISIERLRNIEKSLGGMAVSFDYDCDLISELWTDRPAMPVSQGFDHDLKYCGRDRSLKIAEVRELMGARRLDYNLLTSPEDIMWLLNIRGNDIKYSPLLISFALVSEEQVLLFVEESKIPLKLASEFDRLGIVMLPYEETEGIISTLPAGTKILINPTSTSISLFKAIPDGIDIIEDISIPARLKAVKNSVEIGNIGKAMVKDGVALSRFFYWFENETGTEDLTELGLAEKLNNFRSMNENYLGPSFSTIVAWNDHGALPHYTPDSASDAIIGEKGILLIDSGGQYLDGTTDITRTIAVGLSTARQKRDFTLVLKGNIELARAKFPLGTKGYQLDILARAALWEDGLNYGHGTGHGVGFCLNVHEGPQNIGQTAGSNSKAIIEPGMVLSDEPAIYREGEYGIRIENLLLCYENEETEFGKFLKFETLSLCYIDKSLIDISLLEKREIDWLNAYHTEVYDKLSPFLTAEEKQWLKEKTSSI